MDIFLKHPAWHNMKGAVSEARAPDGVHFATGTDQPCARLLLPLGHRKQEESYGLHVRWQP